MKSWQLFFKQVLVSTALILSVGSQSGPTSIYGKSMRSSNSFLEQQKQREAGHQPTPQREPGENGWEDRDENPEQVCYHLIVVTNQNSLTNDAADHLHFVRYGFLKKLRQSPALSVTDSGVMSRPEAVERAKKEKQAFVVWLDLEDTDRLNPIISYRIFQPETGEIKNAGEISLQHKTNAATGEDVFRGGPPARGNQYVSGGIEVAAKVLAAFKITIAPERL